jgi:molybdate transport system substrate-binding protein
MKPLLGFASVLLLLASGCSTPGTRVAPAPLAVAAAADLRFALDELTPLFKQENGGDVAVTYGSSGSIYAQLANGAPFDLFLSADVAYPRKLVEQGLADPESLFTYAFGRIVVWVPKGSPLPVEGEGLKVLVAPGISHVAIANPEHAPYGRAAEAAMRAAGVFEAVKGKLVLGENIAQTLQFVETGAAEVGIVALSLAKAASDSGRYAAIPSDHYPPIEQGGVIPRAAAHADAARAFRTFLLGSTARAVLDRYGFVTP